MPPDEEKPEAPEQGGGEMQQFLQELVPVLDFLAKEIADIKEDYGMFKDGLKGAYRKQSVDGLRSRHGEKFGSVIKQLSGATGESEDGFWDEFHDLLGKLGGDEEILAPQILDHLGGKRDAMMKALSGASDEGEISGMGGGEAPKSEVKVEAAGKPEEIEKGLEKAKEVVKETPKAAKKEEKPESPAVGSEEWFKKDNGKKGPKKPPKAQK